MSTRHRVLALHLLLSSAAAAQVLGVRAYPAGGLQPDMADLNGDGLVDVVTAGGGVNAAGVVVLLRDPAGGFLPPKVWPVSPFVYSVALGHFDGDDVLDVAWSNGSLSQGLVGVSLGLPGGGFTSGPTYTVAPQAQWLVAEDLDGDGDDDVAVQSRSNHCVTILLGNSLGGLVQKAVVPVGFYPGNVEAGDLDGDGDIDLGVPCASDEVSLLFNDGSANFTAASVAAPDEPQGLAMGDVDEDDDLDLVVACDGLGALLLGQGDGSFAPAQLLASHLAHPRLADLDGDGWQDIVAYTDFSLSFLHGEAGPGFAAPAPGLTTGTLFGPLRVLEANDDGFPDVLVFEGWMGVHRGRGFGELEGVQRDDFEGQPSDVALADLDHDGDLDAAVATNGNTFGGGVCVLRNEHGLQLTKASDIGLGKMTDVEVGHVNSDDHVDVVSTSPYGASLKVQLGDGTLLYGSPPTLGGALATQDSALADLDGDGDDDIATCWGTGPAGRLGYFTSDGAGGFSGPLSKSIGVSPIGIEVADLNVDGELDLVGLAETEAVGVLRHGSAFFAPVHTPLPPNSLRFDVGDIDADGLPDLVTAHYTGAVLATMEVRVALGDGAGGFALHQTLAPFSHITDLVIADMDGDGTQDVVGSEYLVFLLRNGGAGTLGPVQWHVGNGYASGMAVGDVSGDGHPDAVMVHEYIGGLFAQASVVRGVGPDSPWIHLGGGKAGPLGIPMLVAKGSLLPGTLVTLELRGAAPNAATTLIVGLAPLLAPFKGGVLVPQPDVTLGGVATDAEGRLLLAAQWPAGVPSGLQLWFQHWVADASASFGLAASNGARVTVP